MSDPVETADSATTGRSEPAVAKTVPRYLRPAFLLTFFGVSLVLVLVLGLGNMIMNTPRGRFGGGIFSVALALHHYHDVFDTLPPGTVFAPGLSPEQRFSWAILIEPYSGWGQRPGNVEPGLTKAGTARIISDWTPTASYSTASLKETMSVWASFQEILWVSPVWAVMLPTCLRVTRGPGFLDMIDRPHSAASQTGCPIR